MQTLYRPQLIQDLSDTALGLIEESEHIEPQDARALIELAGSLDKLRVKLLSDYAVAHRATSEPHWMIEKRH